MKCFNFLNLFIVIMLVFAFSTQEEAQDIPLEIDDIDYLDEKLEAIEELTGSDDTADVERQDPFFFTKPTSMKKCSGRQKPTCAVTRYSNGCGPNGILNKFAKTFKPSCNKHDICYHCGGTKSWSQKNCDKSFKSDMYKACNCRYKRSWLRKSLCKGAANILYRLVRLGGTIFYKRKSKSVCRLGCVNSHGSPYIPV